MAGVRAQLQEWARFGAQQRVAELQTELAVIAKHYPDLVKAKRGRAILESVNSAPPAKVRKNYKMTAAAKKAVSLRMKKYWADRRAQGAAKK